MFTASFDHTIFQINIIVDILYNILFAVSCNRFIPYNDDSRQP